jgi:hypothetical protein
MPPSDGTFDPKSPEEANIVTPIAAMATKYWESTVLPPGLVPLSAQVTMLALIW